MLAPSRRFAWTVMGCAIGVGVCLAVGVAWAALARAEAARGRRPAAAEVEIRRLLEDQAEAWNRGDLDGFMAGYWESDDLRFASGDTVTFGYEATKERYAQNYLLKPDAEMGQLTFSELTVEFVTHEFAVVRGRWELELVKTPDKHPHGLFTLTLKRFPVGWRVTSDHTSAPQPPKPTEK